MLEVNDRNLVERAQGGDVNAVGELYDRHHASIFRYVWSQVNDKHLAEDLTGEIFTRMVINLSSYQGETASFRAWLYRIARNLVIDHYRKERGREPLPLYEAEQIGSGRGNPGPVIEQQITAERLHAALANIDPVQKEVVTLRFLAGLSLKEVASALNKSVASVKALQHRGLKSLRMEMNQL